MLVAIVCRIRQLRNGHWPCGGAQAEASRSPTHLVPTQLVLAPGAREDFAAAGMPKNRCASLPYTVRREMPECSIGVPVLCVSSTNVEVRLHQIGGIPIRYCRTVAESGNVSFPRDICSLLPTSNR